MTIEYRIDPAVVGHFTGVCPHCGVEVSMKDLDLRAGVPPVGVWMPLAGAVGLAFYGAWKIVKGIRRLWSGLVPSDGVHTGF